MNHFIIKNQDSGKYIALDTASGGYPYLVDDWSRAEVWKDEQQARLFVKMFSEKKWHLYEVSLRQDKWLTGNFGETNDKCVHTEHCCIFHGCKYGDSDCPVERQFKPQSFACEECQYS